MTKNWETLLLQSFSIMIMEVPQLIHIFNLTTIKISIGYLKYKFTGWFCTSGRMICKNKPQINDIKTLKKQIQRYTKYTCNTKILGKNTE